MHNDSISAFLDGELDDAEIDDVLDQLSGDAGRAQLQRLCVARAALSGCPPSLRSLDLTADIAVAVGREPLAGPGGVHVLPVARLKRRRWALPAGGLALAASIVAAVIVLRVAPPVADPAAQPATVALQAVEEPVRLMRQAEPVSELVIAAPTQSLTRPAGSSSVAARQQLNAYMLNHARYGGGYAMSGPLGYARVAAHGGDASGAGER